MNRPTPTWMPCRTNHSAIPATPSPPYTDTTVQSGTKSIFRVHALKNNGVKSELTNPAEITVP